MEKNKEGSYTLTAEEIRELDNLRNDKEGMASVLKIAMNYAANRRSELLKAETKWWDNIMNKHNLSRTVLWTVDRDRGEIVVAPERDAELIEKIRKAAD